MGRFRFLVYINDFLGSVFLVIPIIIFVLWSPRTWQGMNRGREKKVGWEDVSLKISIILFYFFV